MGEVKPEPQEMSGEEQGRESCPAGSVCAGKIVLYLALGALGTALLLWSRSGYRQFLEASLSPAAVAVLPYLLIPLWLLCILAIVMEVRRGRSKPQDMARQRRGDTTQGSGGTEAT